MKISFQKIFLPILACLSLFQFSQCSVDNKKDLSANFMVGEKKQKGVHYFGRVDSIGLASFKKNNVEWITIVPFGDQSDFDSPNLRFGPHESLRRIQRDSMWKGKIEQLQEEGFKVFLKPHIWLGAPSEGKWRSDIFPKNENDWKLWSKNYRDFILHFAKIAAQTEVELFCIGTELTRLTIEKPEFWRALIQEVKQIYKGKITYAANWYQEYENITFWDELDYIGIQAYFPLAKTNNPSVQNIIKGWQPHLSQIEQVMKKFKKKILFTELGYKSTEDSAITPWEWPSYDSEISQKISYETQANCYRAFFQTVWKKEWFAGIHIWQWTIPRRNRNGINHGFTPYNKLAEKIIEEGFKN